VNRNLSNNDRFSPFLVTIVCVVIACSIQPASSQINITKNQPLKQFREIDRVSFSEAMAQFSNNNADEKFKQEQLKDSNSSTTVSNVKDVDGWTQPIGWLFGLVFVMLAVLAAWSKYNQKR
jgi:nucleoside recognition membrane protein YjiH